MTHNPRAPHAAQPLAPVRSRSGRTSIILLALLVLVPAAGVLGGLYLMRVRGPQQQSADEHAQLMLKLTGLGAPVTNRLAARFTDADGDLVADPPTDPKLLVDPPELTFSYIAVDEAADYAKDWQPFVDHLSKVTGKPVKYDTSLTDVKDQLKALREGKLQVTGLNTGSVPKAVNACGFVPVAILPTPDGSGLTRMRLIVPADSPLKSPADVKGSELAFTETASNSGYKAAIVVLRGDFGLLPSQDYTWRYSGGHEESIAGIKAKKYKVAAVADDMLGRALAAGTVSQGDYRSVYESEKFPTAGLGYAYNLTPELAKKVREAITSFDWKGTPLEHRIGGAGTGTPTKFVSANYKNDWPLIRRIDDATGSSHATE
ncbi:MAG: phosphonate transporter, periplasmic phosphonate-binding protein [Phycisphaerales bacterium]|nr:phosphonate transporter, periplasmic phosphonate-binding protein [Phycisphaerales bacterium]